MQFRLLSPRDWPHTQRPLQGLFQLLAFFIVGIGFRSLITAPGDGTGARVGFRAGQVSAAESAAAPEPAPAPEDLDFFEKRIRPILVNRCYECHSAKSEKLRGGLLLDHREAILKGGDTGPAAVPGNVEKSLLIEAISFRSSEIEMPPAGKLPAREIEDLTEWVRRGLPFPVRSGELVDESRKRGTVDLGAGRRHWAFVPLQTHSPPSAPRPLPAVTAARSAVDLWVQQARHQQSLTASSPASRGVLERRAALLIAGLPPLTEWSDVLSERVPLTTAASLPRAADEPDAYEREVDRLLASPRVGERLARFWLDLARYCDVPESWREGEAKAYLYRDWVIQAFNEDLPFADFVRRQLAADLLPQANPNDNAALGFLGLSPTYWKELKLDHVVIKQVVAEEWEEKIEAIGGTFLGLTLACARCHDHKFDPITTADYYGLAGVLASSRQDDTPTIPLPQSQQARQARQAVAALEKQIAAVEALKPLGDEQVRELEFYRQEVARHRQTEFFDLPLAFGMTESSLHVLPDGPQRTKLEYRAGQPQDVAVQIRGNPAKLGELIPRRFPTVLARDPQHRFTQGSGRLELADAILGDASALSSRVYVNRIWRLVFGRGLVASTSNFGIQGDRPTHPELLDHLAQQFLEHDGSTKWLLRQLLTTATFRQSSGRVEESWEQDPENIYLWRMPLRRLDVEAWRDTMLQASGQLDLRIGGAPRELLEANQTRRTLYGVVRRRELNDLLRLFDFPDPVSHQAAREPTTTPLQQLFVLNSGFMQQQTASLAALLQTQPTPDPRGQIRLAYQRLYGRQPSESQLNLGEEFLQQLMREGHAAAAAWQQYVQVLLSSNELWFVE